MTQQMTISSGTKVEQPKKSDLAREHILAIGQGLITTRGFTGLGLGELLKTAKVPKGSFYHYFASKEDFGAKLLEHYMDSYMVRLDELEALDLDGRGRLFHYWQAWIESQSEGDCERRCLVVKLSAEISDISDPMRLIVATGTRDIIARLAKWIAQGQGDGSLSKDLEAMPVAESLYNLWLGASLRAKLEKGGDPLQAAMAMTEHMLPKP